MAPPPSLSQPALVARLRAAGCVFAEDEARLLAEAARTGRELDAMVERRVGGEPLEQVVGWAELCGLQVAVEPGVFVPRRRTELLAREATALVRPGAIVVDLCCGSGALAAVLAAACEPIELHAVDVDPVAVRCARANLAAVGPPAVVRLHEGDLFEPLPAALRGRVDLIVANAPYVPTGEVALLPREARLHEPRIALDGGADGLDVQRRLIAAGPEWLAPGGHLLVETSAEQAPASAAAVTTAGLTPRVIGSEELEATVVVGTQTP